MAINTSSSSFYDTGSKYNNNSNNNNRYQNKKNKEQEEQVKEAEKEKEKKSNKVKEILKDTYYEWALTSTAHGLANIFKNTNIFLKLIWIVCFFSSAGYCGYSIYKNICTYFEYNVITQIAEYAENPILFPAVTYCLSNAFVTQQAFSQVQEILLSQGVTSIENAPFIQQFYNFPEFQETANLFVLSNLALLNTMSYNDTVKQSLGYNLTFMTAMCVFSNLACNMSQMRWYYDENYGNCYQFNTGFDVNNQPVDLLYSYETGKKNGIIMQIFVGISDNQFTLSTDVGAQIFIHNQSEPPSSVDSIALRPGSLNYVSVEKVFSQLEPLPYNDCYDDLTSPDQFDSEFYKLTFTAYPYSSAYTYQQSRCIDICIQSFIISSCGCAEYDFPLIYNATYCSGLLKLLCIYKAVVELSNTAALSNCYTDCPLECSSQNFNIQISSTNYPSPSYASLLASNTLMNERLGYLNLTMNQANLASSLTEVYIYFSNDEYTLISESPAQEISDLLSAIGGTLGLYLGMSFLSFVEFVEIFLQFMIVLYKHRPKNDQKNKMEEEGEEEEETSNSKNMNDFTSKKQQQKANDARVHDYRRNI